MSEILYGLSMIGFSFVVLFILLASGQEAIENFLVRNAKWVFLSIVVATVLFVYYHPIPVSIH